MFARHSSGGWHERVAQNSEAHGRSFRVSVLAAGLLAVLFIPSFVSPGYRGVLSSDPNAASIFVVVGRQVEQAYNKSAHVVREAWLLMTVFHMAYQMPENPGASKVQPPQPQAQPLCVEESARPGARIEKCKTPSAPKNPKRKCLIAGIPFSAS